MSSSEKEREVYFDEEENAWFYSVDREYTRIYIGPYATEEQATEAMQLHGLEE